MEQKQFYQYKKIEFEKKNLKAIGHGQLYQQRMAQTHNKSSPQDVKKASVLKKVPGSIIDEKKMDSKCCQKGFFKRSLKMNFLTRQMQISSRDTSLIENPQRAVKGSSVF